MNLPTMTAHVCRNAMRVRQETCATTGSRSLRMCSSSRADTPRCSPGGAYSRSQITIQANPIAPVSTNAQRQPRLSAIHGTTSGAMIAPMFVPELKMPVASARSDFGNHSATVLIAAGKLPDSPRPRPNRAAPNVRALVARPCDIAATLHAPTAIA